VRLQHWSAYELHFHGAYHGRDVHVCDLRSFEEQLDVRRQDSL
jgi:hypothetical protein